MKNKSYGILLIALLFLMSGCEKAPESSTKDGVSFAQKAEVNETSNGKPENSDISREETASFEGDIPSSLNETIKSDLSTMRIDASVENIPSDHQAYSGTMEIKEFDIDKLQEVLLGNASDKEAVVNQAESEDGSESEPDGTAESKPDGTSEGIQTGTWDFVSGEESDVTAQLTITPQGLILFINLELDRKYPNNTTASVEPLGEIDAPNTTLTRKEALEQLENVLHELGAPEMKISDCSAYQTSDGKGYYQMQFVPVFHETVLTSGLPTFSDSNIYEIFGRAILTEDGFMELTGNFMLDIHETDSKEMLSLGEIKKIIKDRLDNGRMIVSPDVPVKRIAFEYLSKYEGEKLQIVPIWHFYSDTSKLADMDTTELPGVTAFGINAVSGDIEFAY